MTNPEPQTPASWSEIGLCLSLAVPWVEWREAPWLPPVICGDGEPGRIRAYRLVEAPHVAQLESAVRQWLDTGEPPTLAHPASYLLALRFGTVGHYLRTFDKLFPPPATPQVGDIYERLLLDWWSKRGAWYAVGYSCCEYDIDADA